MRAIPFWLLFATTALMSCSLNPQPLPPVTASDGTSAGGGAADASVPDSALGASADGAIPSPPQQDAQTFIDAGSTSDATLDAPDGDATPDANGDAGETDAPGTDAALE